MGRSAIGEDLRKITTKYNKKSWKQFSKKDNLKKKQ